MRNLIKITLVFSLILFQSCAKEEDDLVSQDCDFDCTRIVGKFVTDNGTVPIPNIELTVQWDNIGFLSSGVRRNKATTKTDADGNFDLSFFIRDDEIESGSFKMIFDVNKNIFYNPNDKDINFFQISRDTIITVNYNVPQKAFLNLKLLNLEDIQRSDNLTTNFIYNLINDFKQPDNGRGQSFNAENDSVNLIEVPSNQTIEIEIQRRKNGVSSTENDSIIIAAGETLDYEIDFNN